MFTKFVKIFSTIAVVTVLVLGALAFNQTGTVYASSLERRGGPSSSDSAGYGQQSGSRSYQASYAVTPLTDSEKEALTRAILEEYGAFNLYQSIIDQFGSVVPFAQIVRSEQQHINALTRLAVKYGVEVPANPGLTDAPQFATLADACEAGAAAEIADAALYDELSPLVAHTDILQVFSNLKSASLNSHLPAFEACY